MIKKPLSYFHRKANNHFLMIIDYNNKAISKPIATVGILNR